MEEFVISDLIKINGILSVAVLDSDGFAKFSLHKDINLGKKMSQMVDLMNTNGGFHTTTLITDKYVILILELEKDQSLIILGSNECNMGAIRDAASDSVRRLNKYFQASSR